MRDKVEKVLGDIRRYLMADGGNIEVVNVDEGKGIVNLRMLGGCATCPMAQTATLKFIEQKLKGEIPEIKDVRLVY